MKKGPNNARRPTAANEGPCRFTKAKKGPKVCLFFNLHFYFLFFIPTKPMKAHSSQRQPTQANAGQHRPTAANKGQCRPTTANTGQQSQRKPTQASAQANVHRYFFFLYTKVV